MNALPINRQAGPAEASGFSMPVAPGSDGTAFDLPRYVELTYQEYTYCSQPKSMNDWLCDTLGICGGKHG